MTVPDSRLAGRPVVIFESLARVANSELIYKTLETEGLARGRLIIDAVVREREPGKIKRRQLTEGAAELASTLTPGSVVLLVGNTPLEAVTGKKGIKQKRGRPFEQDGVLYLPMMPPGVTLYDEKQLPMIVADLRLFADMVKKGEIPREDDLDWTIVDSPRKFTEMLADLSGTVSFDIETGRFENGEHQEGALYPWVEGGKIVSIGFGTRSKQWCLPLNHPESTWKPDTHQDLIDRIGRRLRHCYTVAHNGKFDSLWLKVHFGVDWRCDFDTMIGHFMLDENARHGLKLLAQVYYGAPNYDADLDTKSGAGPIGKHCHYLAHDVYYTRKLRYTIGKELEKDPGVERVFEQIMMPLASLFVDIEYHGVYIDVERWEEAEVYLRDLLKKAHSDLHKTLKRHGIDTERFTVDKRGRPQPLNLGSPKQLAKLFFEDLKLPILDKTPKGAPSTGESVLLRIEHPAAEALIRWRGADQMLKMFIEGWKPFLRDGRLHPSFKLHGTVTHRASCEKPNLQQVPRESLIRSLIGAPAGWVLLEIDLSQIEMRIAAELSGDETLLGLFDRDEDVHWKTMVSSLARGGGGNFADRILQFPRLLCMRYGIPADKRGAEVLHQVLKGSKSGEIADSLLQACRREWENKESRHRERWERADFSGLAGWLKVVAAADVSEGLLRAMREYVKHQVASHRRGYQELGRIQFGDALSILSSAGPQLSEGLDPSWKEARKKAKAVNFGFLFGMWHKKFAIYARDNYGVKITEQEAKKERELFFSLYPRLAEWHERQKRYARRHGQVRSLSGALRRLPAAMGHEDSPERGEAQRQAINSPVQEFACMLNYMSLLQIVQEFGLEVVRPTGTIHDAILIEVREDHIERVYTRALEIMEHPALLDEFGIELRVPIKGEAKVGPWSKGVSLEKYLQGKKAA